jgi:hypothetical protein
MEKRLLALADSAIYARRFAPGQTLDMGFELIHSWPRACPAHRSLPWCLGTTVRPFDGYPDTAFAQ